MVKAYQISLLTLNHLFLFSLYFLNLQHQSSVMGSVFIICIFIFCRHRGTRTHVFNLLLEHTTRFELVFLGYKARVINHLYEVCFFVGLTGFEPVFYFSSPLCKSGMFNQLHHRPNFCW